MAGKLDLLGEFISRVAPSISNAPQQKMSAKQALSMLQKSLASKAEISNTLPSLTRLATDTPNAPLTTTHLAETYADNPFSLTAAPPRTGDFASNYSLSDEVIWDEYSMNELTPDNHLLLDKGRLDAYHNVTEDTVENGSAPMLREFLDLNDPSTRDHLVKNINSQFSGDANYMVDPVVSAKFIDSNDPRDIKDFVHNHLPQIQDISAGNYGSGYLKYKTGDEVFSSVNEAEAAHRTEFNNWLGIPHEQTQPTQFQSYTSRGPAYDYAERPVILDSPAARADPYTEPHGMGENTMFHTRTSMRPEARTNTPLHMLEEMQSQQAQTFREYGIQGPKTYEPEHFRSHPNPPEDYTFGQEVAGDLAEEFPPGTREYFVQDMEEPLYRPDLPEDQRFTSYSAYGPDEETAIGDLMDMLAGTTDRRRPFQNTGGTPYEPPYQGDALNKLMLNKAIADAVESGSPGLAFPLGKEQVRRYPGMQQSEAEGLRAFYDQIIPRTLKKMTKKYGTEPEFTRINKGEHLGDRGLTSYKDFEELPLMSDVTDIPRRAALMSERVHYLPFTEELIAAAKAGIPLSLLTMFANTESNPEK